MESEIPANKIAKYSGKSMMPGTAEKVNYAHYYKTRILS
jgi:hypothetical protein